MGVCASLIWNFALSMKVSASAMRRLCVVLSCLPCSWCDDIATALASGPDTCRLVLPELHDSGAHAAHLDGEVDSVPGEWRQLFEGYVYSPQFPSGFGQLSRKELRVIDKNSTDSSCKPSTFAEMNALRLFEDSHFAFTPDDVYVDLGSGVGKSALGAVLFFNATRAIGIELSKARFDKTCEAIGRVRNALHGVKCGPHCRERARRAGRVEFVHTNILDYDLSEIRPTRVSVFTSCFPKKVQKLLQKKLLAELPLDAVIYAPGLKVWDDRTVVDGKMLRHEPASGSFGSIFTVIDVTTEVANRGFWGRAWAPRPSPSDSEL